MTINTGRKSSFLLGTGFSYISTISNLLITLITIPLLLKHFGTVTYGLISVITSIVAYLSFVNLGIPTASGVIAAKADNRESQLVVVFRSFFVLVLLCLVLIPVFYFIHQGKTFVIILENLTDSFTNELSVGVTVAALLYLLNIPFSIFFSGFVAAQKIYIEKIYYIASLVLGLIVVVVTASFQKGLIWFLAARGIATVSVSIIGMLHYLFFFNNNRLTILGSIYRLFQKDQNETRFFSILQTGFRHSMVGVAALIVWNTDNLVVSKFLGVESVTPYSITFRVITTLFFVFTAVNAVLAPMYGQSFVSRDYDWINNTYNRVALLTSIVGGLVWVGSVCFAKTVINLWVGPDGYAGLLAVFALGGYGYILSQVNVHSMLMTGTNLIKNSVVIGWAEAIVNLILSLILVRFLGLGGVALGTFLAALFTVFWMLPREINIQSKNHLQYNFSPVFKHFFYIVLPLLTVGLLVQINITGMPLLIALNFILVILYVLLSWLVFRQEIVNILEKTGVLSWLLPKNR